MVRVVEAVFSNGLLKPLGTLQFREEQRVRLIIEPIDGVQDRDRAAALNRLREGIATMTFSSAGPLSSRDELYGRP